MATLFTVKRMIAKAKMATILGGKDLLPSLYSSA
jgi:hypothetical protein